MTKVLLVAAEGSVEPVVEAFERRGIKPKVVAPKDGVPHARGADVIAVTAFADDATGPRYAAHLLGVLGAERRPPVIVWVASPATRDAAFIAGATDVAFDVPDELAERALACLAPWERGSTTPIQASLRLQSGREVVTVQTKDFDPTGLGLADSGSLVDGQLVRFQLPLSAGPLILWGRCRAVAEGYGIRFVGLSASENSDIRAEVDFRRGLSETSQTSGPDAPADAQGSCATPGPSLVRSEPAESSEDEGRREEVDASEPDGGAEGSEKSKSESAAVNESAEDARETSAPGVAEKTTDGDEMPESTPDAKAASPFSESIGESIGDLLADALGEVALEGAEGEPGALAPVVERTWPEHTFDTQACIEVLTTAASIGLATEVENAPSGDTVLLFLRTTTPIERRLFESEPPSELPPPELGERCLALRLRCFALCDEAAALPHTGVKWTIDDALVDALKAEVSDARAQIQRLVEGLVAEAATERIRTFNAFANALERSFSNLRQLIASLKGEVQLQASGALLDVAEQGEEEQTKTPATKRRSEAKAQEKKKPAAHAPVFKRTTAAQAARKRLVGLGVVLVVAVGIRIVFWPASTQVLSGAELQGLAGIVEVKLPPPGSVIARPQPAVIIVTAAWRPEDAQAVAKVKTLLRTRGMERMVVLDSEGAVLATGTTNANDKLMVIGKR